MGWPLRVGASLYKILLSSSNKEKFVSFETSVTENLKIELFCSWLEV